METETRNRGELIANLIEAHELADELGKALLEIACHAGARDDLDMMRHVITIDAMPRRGGRHVDLNSCEAFGAVAQRVSGDELRAWSRAVSACMDIGSPDILAALDALARRRACH